MIDLIIAFTFGAFLGAFIVTLLFGLLLVVNDHE